MNLSYLFLFFSIIQLGLDDFQSATTDYVYESEFLKIEAIAEGSFRHESLLHTDSWGKVGCNGAIFINGNEALILDSPVDEQAAKELEDWIVNVKNAQIKAIIPTHFHIDCIGALPFYHSRNVASFASRKTIKLIDKDSFFLPRNELLESHDFQLANNTVLIRYPGEGHTQDNIVAYNQEDKVLFGGCLIKSDGSGKGNLEDANVEAWSETVINVKNMFPDIIHVIPGHGKAGGVELLDYTIEMFKQ